MRAGLLLLLVTSGHAHGPDECPPQPVLAEMAAKGLIPPEAERCVTGDIATPEGRSAAWIGWRNRLAKEGPAAGVLARAEELLDRTVEADLLLAAGESLAESGAPAELGVRALESARDRAGQWTGLVSRVERLDRLYAAETRLRPESAVQWAQGLTAAGMVGPRLEQARAKCREQASDEVCATGVPFEAAGPPPPGAVDLSVCTDVGRMWAQAMFGRPYATERDCVVRALDGVAASAPPADRESLARVALLLSIGHRDKAAAAVVARRLADVFSSPEPALAAHARELHEQAGDDVGVRFWDQYAADRARAPH